MHIPIPVYSDSDSGIFPELSSIYLALAPVGQSLSSLCVQSTQPAITSGLQSSTTYK